MPRGARLHLAGGLFHVVSRFARGTRWLERDGARDAYLNLIARACAGNDLQLLAYCLMSNHVHLVMVQGTVPLSRFMKSVNTGFAAFAFGGKARKKGHPALFADRPRMLLIEPEQLLVLVRYVHNNPVRAGVVRAARNSPWSSHRAYISKREAPSWLRTAHVLERFGGGARAAAKFDAFVDEGRSEARRPELSGASSAGEANKTRRALGEGQRFAAGIFGSERFIVRARREAAREGSAPGIRPERRAANAARPSLREVVDAVLEWRALDREDLERRPKARASSHAKRLIVWLWVHEYGGTQVEVARALSLETGAVSRHYGHALERATEFAAKAAEVVVLLRRQIRRREKLLARSPHTAAARAEPELRRSTVSSVVDDDSAAASPALKNPTTS